MTVQGNTVLATDFNGVRNLGVELISIGSIVGRGYGQDVKSGGTLAIGTTVTPGYLDGLRNDLFNTRAHQIGTAPALAETAVVGNIITATDVATFTNYVNLCDTNRFTADAGRMATTSYTAQTRTASWNSSLSAIFTITFNQGPVVARYFFNAGGQIRITSSRTGGSSTSQNTSWSNLLSGAGTQSFGASTIYSLTQANTYTQLFTTTATAPYASNRYTISGSAQGGTGGSGVVSQFNFLLQWTDPYVDPSPGNPPAPDDLVDGTLSYTVSLLYPVGGAALSGGGNWRGFNSNGALGYFVLPVFNAVQPIVGS